MDQRKDRIISTGLSLFLIFMVPLTIMSLASVHSQSGGGQGSSQHLGLTYNDPSLGVKIDYPADWDIEGNAGKCRLVTSICFSSPPSLEADSSYFEIFISNTSSTLETIVSKKLNAADGELLLSEPINDDTAHAFLTEFDGIKTLNIVTVLDGKLYNILFEPDSSSEYNKYIPVVTKMIESMVIKTSPCGLGTMMGPGGQCIPAA